MSEQMFQQILELVSQAGEGGFVLAVLYLLEGYFSSLLVAGTIITVVVMMGRVLRGLLNTVRVAREVGRMVNFSWHGNLSGTEADSLLDRVRDRLR